MSTCNNTFKLQEINIIGGDYKEFPIKIHDDDRGGFMPVGDLKLNFSLIPYTSRFDIAIITKTCEPDPNDPKAFLLKLLPEETKTLYGKFIYQFTVTTPNKKQESFQGILHIDKNINPDLLATNVTV